LGLKASWVDDVMKLQDERIYELYAAIVGEAGAAKYDRTNGWLRQYHGKLARREDAQRYLRSIRNTVRLSDSELAGKRVLDVGCGFGLTMSTLVWLGAESADGIDMFRHMTETVDAYRKDVPAGERIRATVGRANHMPYSDNHFDIALTIEALSHFLDPFGCIRETYRVLKPGGLYIITDDNNGANPAVVKENQEVWDKFELGPPTDDIHGHRVREPYVNRRGRIIREAAPQLSAEEVDRLAKGTAFMKKDQILDSVSRYLETGTMPESFYVPGKCPVEPEEGQYIENLINPVELKCRMEEIGFRVRLEAYFGGASRGGVVKAANRLINMAVPARAALRFSPGFRIWAWKLGE